MVYFGVVIFAFLNVLNSWMSVPLAPTRSRNQTQSAKWTPEEDQQLISIMQTSPPPSWCSLLPKFPGKTPQQISGRWEKVLNPGLIKGSWTREEDEFIINFVKTNGPRNWVQLAECLPGRIGKQCRERWTNHLSPDVARAGWSEEEDKKLVELHALYGNQWTKIASMMEGRTDNSVKNRWNSSLKRRLERVERGEPEYKKRGRKPKSQQVQEPSRTNSECPSPNIDESPGTSLICVFSDPFVMGLQSARERRMIEPKGSLEQNRLNLELLMKAQVC